MSGVDPIDEIRKIFEKPIAVKYTTNQTYTVSKLLKISTDQKFPQYEKPQAVFRNNLKSSIDLNEISMVLNDNFMESGNLVIKLNNVIIFDMDNEADFSNVAAMNLEFENKPFLLEPDKTITFYAWEPAGKTITSTILIKGGV